MADVDSQLMLWLKAGTLRRKILIRCLFLRMLPSMKDGFLGKPIAFGISSHAK